MTDDIRKKTVLKLFEPIQIEGRTITELAFRRLKGKDLREVERIKDPVEQTAFLLSELTMNPPELFDELDAADIEAASKIIEGFMKRKAR